MAQLEERLRDSYVVISSSGIDYSNFDREKFVGTFKDNFWNLDARMGIKVTDKHGKSTEVLGIFRPFKKRPALTKPVKISEDMVNEDISFDEDLTTNFFKFFTGISCIDPPRSEWTTTYQGRFKKVTVTQIREEKDWWRGMFIDLYVNGQGIIDRLSPVVDRSKKVLTQSQIWKRYEIVRGYLEKLQEKHEEYEDYLSGVEGEDHDSTLSDRDIKDSDIRNLLFRHSRYMKPHLFRDGEDYKYFLLAFKHAGFNLERIHGVAVGYHDQKQKLERMIGDFNSSAESLEIFHLMEEVQLPRGFSTFGEELDKDKLDEVYESVERNGSRMRSPITISRDIQNLGFLALRRSRWKRENSSNESYALIKINVKKEAQKQLPFREFEDQIELPSQVTFKDSIL